MEGRLFTPLGIAYIVSILCSLLVSLTVTPVLAFWLLPRISATAAGRDGLVLRGLKGAAGTAIRVSLAFPRTVLVTATLAALAAGGTFFLLKRDFTPPFNEGALQLNINLLPGKSLDNSVAVARALEQRLQQVEGVQTIIRKTGRAELDEHAVPVNTTEFILTLARDRWRQQARITDEVKAIIDKKNLPGTAAFCDQPLQHLLAHLRTGSNAQIAREAQGQRPGRPPRPRQADRDRDPGHSGRGQPAHGAHSGRRAATADRVGPRAPEVLRPHAARRQRAD